MTTDEGHTDPAKAGTIAQRIVAILINESSETRRRAIHAAMMLLGEEPVAQVDSRSRDGRASGDDDEPSLSEFFGRDEKLRPSENAYLCAAYHFSLYGNATFSLDELRAIAAEAGVVLPDRLDMTLKQAGKAGKRLFQAAGRDAYKPTAAAGLQFKERWDVRPGNRPKGASAGQR